MLISFSVGNFGSVKTGQTLSFLPDKSDHHLEEHFLVEPVPGLKLLKLGMIYGANSSGKTMVLKALAFLRSLIMEPLSQKNDVLKFNPFLFDKDTPQESTQFRIEVLMNGIRYEYMLTLNRSLIKEETLYYYNPKKAVVYTRTTDPVSGAVTLKTGSKISLGNADITALEVNTLPNNTVPGGFLKTNILFGELNEFISWFSTYYLRNVDSASGVDLKNMLVNSIRDGHFTDDDILYILRNADFHLSNFAYRTSQSDYIEVVQRHTHQPKVYESTESEHEKPIPVPDVYKIEFEHQVGEERYKLPYDLESDGTKRFFGLAGLLTLLLKSPCLVLIDELEASLHPDLYEYFLLAFIKNSRQSQLLVTTHNRELLNNKDIFRNDTIWITEKNREGATELYRVSDFDTSVLRKNSSVLQAYKAGKLGGVPVITDYYLNNARE